MDLTTAVGLAAGLLTTISLVPQVTKIWKTKSAEDVSRSDLPMIHWNSISLVLALSILGMNLKFG